MALSLSGISQIDRINATTGFNPTSSTSSYVSPEQAVANIFAKNGVPAWAWIPIMLGESGGNPNAVSNGVNHSLGLFQLNPVGGQGVGYSKSYLLNPVNNASIAVKYIAPAYKKCMLQANASGALDRKSIMLCTAANSGHLGLVAPYSNAAADAYDSLTSGKTVNGWGLNGQVGEFQGQSAQNTSGGGGSATATNPNSGSGILAGAENFITKNWQTWAIALGIIVLIIVLVYKGVTG